MARVKIEAQKANILPAWDLSAAYYTGLDDEQIESDKKDLKKLAKEISLYRDTIWELEPYELSILLRKYETLIDLSRKISYFAFLFSTFLYPSILSLK